MKKVLVISIVLVLALAVVASADWVATVAGTGGESKQALTIGQGFGGTNAFGDDMSGLGLAVESTDLGLDPAGTFISVTSQGSLVDFRDVDVPQIWTISLTKKGGYTGAIGFQLRFANINLSDVEELGDPNVAGYMPDPSLQFTLKSGATTLASWTSAERQINVAGVTGPLTLEVAPPAAPIPEPGSMLALGSGLVGLVGFAMRRRK